MTTVGTGTKRRKNEIRAEDVRGTIEPLKGLEFDGAFQVFITDCKVRNLSPHSVKYYESRLTEFKQMLEGAGKETDPGKVSLDDIKEVAIIPQMERGLKPTTINNRLRAIRTFFNFLYNEGRITKNPVEKLKLVREKREIVDTFSNEQIRLLLAQPDLRTFTGQRDFTIMLIMLETGVRIRELCDVTVNDVNLKDGLIMVSGKNFKQRNLPIQNKTKQQLNRYMQLRGELETEALLVTIDNTPLTTRQVQQRINDYGKRAGIKNVRVSPHTFRHTFARLSIVNGCDAFTLKHILGHSTFEMTNRYVNMFSTEINETHRRTSPVEKLL